MKYLLILLTLVLLQSCNDKKRDAFSLCGIGITKPYYVTGLVYKGEIYQVEKQFRDNFIKPSRNADGIAKISFKVNCNGELGDLYYEEYNLDYEKSNLNDSIEIQIRNITSNLKDWIPGTDDDGNPVNSHSFLSFRIANGEIVEILPK